MNKEKILKAGKIASEVREYARTIIKKNVSLIEIANNIEKKIIELGGKPAFPVNLSINELAAHYTPGYDDKKLAYGLLKIDLGVHIDGWVADTAFSLDLENSEENKKLIESSEKALNEAINKIKININANEIGKVIHSKINNYGFTPIINLSGHEIGEYDLHAGITIPNIDDKKEIPLKKGLYAIEPFSTQGTGKVIDGKLSGIYKLIEERTPRSQSAREILEFIAEEYNELPFCSRWIFNKFGARGLFALKQLEDNGNLHHFPQLVEVSKKKVSQAEHTILIEDKEIIVTTK